MRFASVTASTALVVRVLAPSALPAQADSTAAPGLSVYAEARVVTRYVWRGYDASRSAPSVQPYVEFSLPFGVTANGFATGGLDRHTQLDEAQIGVGYAREIGRGWELGAGYLQYVLTGTETEPSPGGEALATSYSGEIFLSAKRSWNDGFAALTYSRGTRAGRGNSLNLWVEWSYAWAGDRWAARPYFQADYLDQYDAPAGLEQRLSMIEIGLPVLRRLGCVQLLASVHVSFVPSPWVRASNAESGASGSIAIPWFGIGVVVERD